MKEERGPVEATADVEEAMVAAVEDMVEEEAAAAEAEATVEEEATEAVEDMAVTETVVGDMRGIEAPFPLKRDRKSMLQSSQ